MTYIVLNEETPSYPLTYSEEMGQNETKCLKLNPNPTLSILLSEQNPVIRSHLF